MDGPTAEGYFTAGTGDAVHIGRPTAHNRGLALDFTINDPSQAPQVAAQIRAKLAEMGINATVLDEYTRPSQFSTAPHIHVQFKPKATYTGGTPANV